MQLYSTKNTTLRSSFKNAVFQGLPPDNGLFMPVEIPILPSGFPGSIAELSFQEIAFLIAHAFIGDEIPNDALRQIIQRSITFPAPVVALNDKTHILELFHGPSLAFKDFGARFMAQVLSYFNSAEKQDLTILVATSGDTGGAVASGFYQTPGINVTILYPSGKVSPLQEKQIAALGHNISAIEIDGTFDDCQSLVKQAFLDTSLRQRIRLSSANSINIARLMPQIFYYWEAYKQLSHQSNDIVFVVPSGNFGNLTAGLIAQKMGLPVHHFVTATNTNDVVPLYLKTGKYEPRSSVPTLSNAMDVGNPSNFPRMLELFGSTWNTVKSVVSGYSFSDALTIEAILKIEKEFGYVMDPHGAVGYLAWEEYRKQNPESIGILLETAHPAKFLDTMQNILGKPLDIPTALVALAERKCNSIKMPANYQLLKEWLLGNS